MIQETRGVFSGIGKPHGASFVLVLLSHKDDLNNINAWGKLFKRTYFSSYTFFKKTR